jgi:hypothetical protein
VEGYNNKLKLYVGSAGSNIYKILEILKGEETSADKSIRNAIANPPTKPPPRKNYFVNKDDKFRIFKTLYIEKSITLEVYLKHIIELYKFDRKKIETVGDLTDSDTADRDNSDETYDLSDDTVNPR